MPIDLIIIKIHLNMFPTDEQIQVINFEIVRLKRNKKKYRFYSES